LSKFLKLHFILLLLLCGFAETSFSQQIAKDENGVYKFKPNYIPELIESGLSNPKVSVMWQSLMGEPIEDYKFYWERGFHAFRGEHVDVALKEHPDLLARYKDLRPSFTLSFHVQIGCPKTGDCSYSITHTVSSNEILVKRAGEVANFSLPSSYSWERFFGMNEKSADPQVITDMRQAFIKGAFINVQNVRLYDIKWPQSLDFIWEELLRRRKRKTDRDDNKTTQEDSDDEWATSEDQTDAGSESDSEWATEESNTDNEWATAGSSGTDKKSVPVIEMRNSKYGVVDQATDKVLILFKFDGIKSFKNGLATVRMLTKREMFEEKSGSKRFKWIEEYYSVGTVDGAGNFIAPTRELLIGIPISNLFWWDKLFADNGQWGDENFGMTEYGIEAWEKPIRKFQEHANRVKNSGGIVELYQNEREANAPWSGPQPPETQRTE
jgi:hypothetical protein